MLSLNNASDVSSVLSDTDLDVDLRALLVFRAWQFCVEKQGELGVDFQIFVVQGGDTPAAIESAIGFPIGQGGSGEPTPLHVDNHGLWFEVTYGSSGRPHTCVFVENGPATEMSVHAMCLGYFCEGGQG